MLYQNREILTIPLDDDKFFNNYSTGIFLYKYEYNNDTDTLFKKRMYDSIKEELVKNKYFVLENIYDDGMLLQRLTFMHTNNSYIRTACSGNDVNKFGVNAIYSNGTNRFSEWNMDNINENDPEVKKILKSSSKESVDKRIMSKNSNDFKRIFKYIKRLSLSDFSNIEMSQGFYSVIDEVKEFEKLIPVNKDFYERRSNTRSIPKNEKFYKKDNLDKLQGILEVYKSKKYLLQVLYVSNPFISILNRAFSYENNQWTEWRINQNVDDTYWLQNVNPHSTYVELPIIKRNLYLNNMSLLYKFRGYTDERSINDSLINYAYNKTNSFREKYNEFYKVEGRNPVDFIYGYTSFTDPNMVENNEEVSNYRKYQNSILTQSLPRNRVNWGTNYIEIDFSNMTNSKQNDIYQISSLGTGKITTIGKDLILDKVNNKNVKESFRFINGLSVYWTTDKLYFDILQNIVVDTNVNNDKF